MSQNQENPTGPLALRAAARLDVKSMTIYRYLSGTRYPNLPMVRKIEEQLGWPIADQIRLIPTSGYDMGYAVVLEEVLRENFPDTPAGVLPEKAARPDGQRVRSKAGWTLSSVAEELNTRPGSVSRWLGGARYPEVRTLLRIEKLTGWPASEQIRLIPLNGSDEAYGAAFRAALDRTFPASTEV